MRIERNILREIRICQCRVNPVTLAEVVMTFTPNGMRIGGSGTGGRGEFPASFFYI